MKRTRLKRRGGLGRTAEQLVWLASGLAESGSRIEDRYWEAQLAHLIDELLASNDEDSLNTALDHLYSADSRAYDELADHLESRAECAGGAFDSHDVVLLAAPILAWLLREGLSILLRLLSPITPHICHHLWCELGYGGDILQAPWPEPIEEALAQDEIELVLQVNGKLRGAIKVPATAAKEQVEKLALASEAARKYMEGNPAKKVVVVPGRLVNIVV